MAQYKILRLNKMTSGTVRGLIDMDIQLCNTASISVDLLKGVNLDESPQLSDDESGVMTETGKVSYDITKYICDYYSENEQQPAKNPLAQELNDYAVMLNENQTQVNGSTFDGLTSNPPDAVQVINESQLSTYSSMKDIESYHQQHMKMHVVYEFEKDKNDNSIAVLSGLSSVLLPLNDILDLCIKSRFKKMYANSNVPRNLDASVSKNVDQYLVLDDYPVGMCQCGNDAFVITKLMDMQPWRLKTDNEDNANAAYEHYTYKLVSQPIQTTLYQSLEDLSSDSYKEFIENAVSRNDAVAQLFVQQRKINGIRYNYIVAVDQSSYDNRTVYDNGDIFGYFTTAKNMYNSLYSIEMPDESTMKNCRQYCGVQRSRGKLMLKYYDSIDYKVTGSSAQKDGDGTAVPFQKVEFFQPNKMMPAIAKHKSNLFSVQIRSTGLDDAALAQSTTNEERQTILNIRKDIMNGVKSIAENVVPANTQLFETQFI